MSMISNFARLFFVVVSAGLLSSVSLRAMAAECSENPQRIVSLGGVVTEIVYALGEEKRLVAVDSTSSYPDAANALPKVGYFRQVASEGLLSLGPDLILADADAGPPNVFTQLEQAGVCVVRLPDGGSIDAIEARVKKVAEVLGVEEAGAAKAKEIAAAFEEAKDFVSTFDDRPKVLFLLSTRNGTPMAAGTETEAEDIIRLAGGVNAVSAFEGYKPLSPEIAVASAPDFVLMMDHVLEMSGGRDAVLALPTIQATPAGQRGNLIAMDGLLLLGFGPRTPEAVKMLAQHLHAKEKQAHLTIGADE